MTAIGLDRSNVGIFRYLLVYVNMEDNSFQIKIRSNVDMDDQNWRKANTEVVMIFVPLDQKACSWTNRIVCSLMMPRPMVGMIVVSITRNIISKLIQTCSNVGTFKCLLVYVNMEDNSFQIKIRSNVDMDDQNWRNIYTEIVMIFVPLDQIACSWTNPIVCTLMMTRLIIGMIVVSITRNSIVKLIQTCSNVGGIL